MAIAALGHLGIKSEASFASGGIVDHWHPIDSESMGLTMTNVYGDRIMATEKQMMGRNIQQFVAGSITFGIAPTPSGAQPFWEAGLGQATSPYSGERPLKSLLLEIDRETGAVRCSGCMVNTMAFSSAQGGELKCAVDMEGKAMADTAAGSPTYVSGDAPYLHSEGTFKLNDVEDKDIQSFNISIANNLVTDLYGSELTRQKIPATKRVVTGSFTKMFENTTERNAFIAGDVRSFEVEFARGGNTFKINITKLRYDTRPTPLSGQSDYIIETFNWTAFVDNVAENDIALTVT